MESCRFLYVFVQSKCFCYSIDFQQSSRWREIKFWNYGFLSLNLTWGTKSPSKSFLMFYLETRAWGILRSLINIKFHFHTVSITMLQKYFRRTKTFNPPVPPWAELTPDLVITRATAMAITRGTAIYNAVPQKLLYKQVGMLKFVNALFL